MALDVMAGDPTDMSPWIAVDEEVHSRVFAYLHPLKWPQASRMEDYYTDVCYDIGELPALLTELEDIADEHSGATKATVDALVALVQLAIHLGVVVQVEAD